MDNSSYADISIRYFKNSYSYQFLQILSHIFSNTSKKYVVKRILTIKRNPAVYGVRLTDKQVQDIKDGEYVYLENMKEDDVMLSSGYLVMPDDMKQGWIYQSPPDRIVKEDKFYIREMDKLLADQGYVVRAKIRFWGPEQPESRQYFWKENTGFYDCSHNDPRKPKPKQSREEELHVPSVTPKKKQGGPKL